MSYRVVKIEIEGISPYSASRMHGEPFLNDSETKAEYNERTWAEHAHVNTKGDVFIPRKAWLESFIDAAKRRGTKVPGRGMKTFGGLMEGGMIVMNDLLTGSKKKDLKPATFPCHSNGNRRDTKRVPRKFPMLDEWAGTLTVVLTDPQITKEEFENCVRDAGIMVGVGRYRPANRGDNGRFQVKKFQWSTTDTLIV